MADSIDDRVGGECCRATGDAGQDVSPGSTEAVPSAALQSPCHTASP
jgi:hypothetical protein